MTAAASWAEAMKFANRANPYPFFDELRATPVARVAENTYVVTGYRELLALAHDPRISSDISRSPIATEPTSLTGGSAGAEQVEAYGSGRTILTSDPPYHDRARRQVMRHFGPPHSPGVIPAMESAILELCNSLLDTVAASGAQRLDVVDEYAYPVPVMAICVILGIPAEDEPMFHAWIFDMLAGLDLGPDTQTEEGRDRVQRGQVATQELQRYLFDLVERFRTQPGDGLLSKLINDATGPDGPMEPADVVSNASLLLIAGHDSTVNTITNCIMTLLRNPGSYELLRRRPELIPRTIEEVQRLQAAVQFFPSRSATADIAIAGTVIPQGAAVHLVYAAANRDPKRFEHPNRFDPGREDNEHFGWGSGIHTCLGGPLARLEVNLALEVFLRRVRNPGLIVDPPPYRQSQVFRGPRHLPVTFDAIVD